MQCEFAKLRVPGPCPCLFSVPPALAASCGAAAGAAAGRPGSSWVPEEHIDLFKVSDEEAPLGKPVNFLN